jgi:phosphoglycerate dehydrogenase-like enzyme
MIDAVNSGQLLGAAIDVMSPEPLPADEPPWDSEHRPQFDGGRATKSRG